MRVLRSLTFCVCLLASTSSALAQAQSAPNRDDTVIALRVRSALTAKQLTDSGQIDVQSQNGIVELSGSVDSEATRTSVEVAAKNVAGVRQVQNHLLVRDVSRSATSAADATTAAKVREALGGGAAADIKVAVTGGIVELSGSVATPEEKARADVRVRGVAGVKAVLNNLHVRSESQVGASDK